VSFDAAEERLRDGREVGLGWGLDRGREGRNWGKERGGKGRARAMRRSRVEVERG